MRVTFSKRPTSKSSGPKVQFYDNVVSMETYITKTILINVEVRYLVDGEGHKAAVCLQDYHMDVED